MKRHNESPGDTPELTGKWETEKLGDRTERKYFRDYNNMPDITKSNLAGGTYNLSSQSSESILRFA